jgi:hypothetical protein
MANKTKITPEIAEQIINLINEGYNTSRISKETNLGRTVITLFCQKNNLNPKKRIRPNFENKVEKFLELFKNGMQLKEAMKASGCYYKQATDALKENNLIHLVKTRAEVAKEKILDFEEASKRIPDGGKVIDFENGKYKIVCPDGYIYYKKSMKLHQGDPRGKSGRIISLNEVKKKLEKIGYSYTSDYISTKKSFKAKCLKCDNIRITKMHLFETQQCGSCSNNGTSKAEDDIKSWLLTMGVKSEKYRFAGKTRGREIDIYIPELKLGIEYCGLYWHSEDAPHPRNKNYHKEKLDLCKDKGISLITIFEDEWKNKQFQIKNFILNKIQLKETKIYARDCKAKEIDKETAKAFLDIYHMQGSGKIDYAIGLYYNSELMGVTTGCPHHRGLQEYTLNRLVFKKDTSITGGASKLINTLKDYAKVKGYSKIISWSDNKWSDGNVYLATGWEKAEELPSDYSYCVGNGVRKNKQSCKKKYLKNLGAIGNTELEMAKSLGWSRIWDCGKIRWVLKLV